MKSLSIIALFTLFATITFGQTDEEITKMDKAWLSFERERAQLGGGQTLGFYYSRNKHLFGVRATHIAKDESHGIQKSDYVNKNVNHGSYNEYALTYGRIESTKFFFASLSTGISYLSGKRATAIFGSRSKFEEYQNYGIPLESQLYITPTKWFAVGLSLKNTFLAKEPTRSISIGIQIGKFR